MIKKLKVNKTFAAFIYGIKKQEKTSFKIGFFLFL